MQLTSENVSAVFMDCLFRDEEIPTLDKNPESGQFLKGIGVATQVGFHPERCNGHKQDVIDMLDCLDDAFKKSGGGGMSFLNMCMDKNGEQWTGIHRVVDQLVCLGVALGLVELTPREMNAVLPGGVPYVVVL